ncbi:sodium channel and clathrin linker 1-like isoform X2 [Phycodurus eques]|uniref:sodium channel and clathrin linker 1-like isoform X2 n=1 Tax=Phycodurus eques TaxID=693459 RepID=UPI002ACE11A3|nr:sodium channel and clathrin linker 1-like isoform X2 [Phycodurus eques]
MHFDRLYAKQSVDNEPQSFPNTSGAECTTEEEEALIKNYETLVQLFKQERLHVMEMWQKAAQEVGQFQEINHKAFSDGQQADAMTQKLQNQLVQFIRQSCKLKEINQEVQLTNKHLQMTEKEQNDEIEELHSQLRLKSGPENALEEQTVLETKLGTLQAHCAPLEQDKYEGLNKVHGCVHVAEASARVRERQKTVDLENKDKAIQQFIQEAAVRARKEECTIKEYQIERCKHEKKALEKELEKVTKHRAEQDLGKIIALHQRCLNAERIRDDMSATLQSTQSKVMKFESDSKEELSRSQAEIQRLQSSLAAAWEDCDNISEERLQLQQENLQLHRETNELQRSTLLIQNQAKNRILEMEQECKLKEQTFNAKMMALEERSHNLNADRMHLLTAHQKSIQRSKDEAANMTKAFEARIQQLMTEMNQHKQRLHEVELQLRNNQDTMNEYGSQLAEYQEKSICLQRRATDAEQRAATATQQLSVLTSQRMSSSEAA